MSGQFLHLLFGEQARSLQQQAGSRAAYARLEARGDEASDPLTPRELSFIASRDSAYLATVSPGGWPYVQHRGGPPGFIGHAGGNRLILPAYAGNRQYISTGNLTAEPRLSMFLMDYPARRRLKLIGRGAVVMAGDLPAPIEFGGQSPDGIVAAIVIDVVGFDWNCPQYITPRFTLAEGDEALGALLRENERLRAEIARLSAEGE